MEVFLERITNRADGVFLWVTVVCKSIIQGLKNHDTAEYLEERLDQHPPTIEDIYEQILLSIDTMYLFECDKIIQGLLAVDYSLSLVEFYLLRFITKDRVLSTTNSDLQASLYEPVALALDGFKSRGLDFEARDSPFYDCQSLLSYVETIVHSRCSGLVEIHADFISFSNKTAKDFSETQWFTKVVTPKTAGYEYVHSNCRVQFIEPL